MPCRRDRDAYISGAMDDALEEDNDKLASSIAEKVKKLKERSYDLGMLAEIRVVAGFRSRFLN